jgi:hypothetical protein
LVEVNQQAYEVANDYESHNLFSIKFRLSNFEAKQSKAADRLNKDSFWNGFKQSLLKINPFFLFNSKVAQAISVLDCISELVKDNSFEQIHDKESGEEDVNYKEPNSVNFIVLLHALVNTYGINGIKQVF